MGVIGRTVLFPSLWCLFLLDLARSDLFSCRLKFLLLFDHLLLLWHDSEFGFRGCHRNELLGGGGMGERRGWHVTVIMGLS